MLDLFLPDPLPLQPMRVLIACETSGRGREEFRRRGHDAWSCDLLPSVDGSPFHIQGNAFDILGDGWDFMIAHPTCTKLTGAAAWTMYHPDDRDLPVEERRPHPKFPDRRAEQDQAAEDFMRFAHAPIPKRVVENPVGAMSSRYRSPDQTIQPYQFGDDASKRTCLWLYGVPKLRIPPRELWFPPRMVPRAQAMGKSDVARGNKGPAFLPRWSNQTDTGQNRLGPSEDRWKIRSETFPGIARAFGEQWGGPVVTNHGSESK